MLKELEEVDLMLLDDFFQKIADFFHEHFRTSCFRIAIYLGFLYNLSLAVQIVLYIKFEGGALFMIFHFGIMTWVLLQIFKKITRRENDIDTQYMNSERMFFPYGIIRILFFFFLAVGPLIHLFIRIGSVPLNEDVPVWKEVTQTVSGVLLTCVVYFMACSPKPPSRMRAGNTLAAQA